MRVLFNIGYGALFDGGVSLAAIIVAKDTPTFEDNRGWFSNLTRRMLIKAVF